MKIIDKSPCHYFDNYMAILLPLYSVNNFFNTFSLESDRSTDATVIGKVKYKVKAEYTSGYVVRENFQFIIFLQISLIVFDLG